MYSPLSGSSPNWILQPPSIPRLFIISMDASLSIWFSSADIVCVGATTILSPVCTPTGSTFSISHIIMQLSAPSLITSYSISFQPATDFSRSICPIALLSIPLKHSSSSSSIVSAIPPPVPPRVYAGLIMTGSPSFSINS